MIAEAALFLASWIVQPRVSPSVLRDAVGLWARRRRCRSSWAEHEARTKAAIEKVAAPIKIRRTVVVLGSGLCADVPLDVLSATFQKVILVDLCHLLTIRAKVLFGRYSNVEFRRLDLSGYDRLAEQSRIKMATGQEDLGVGIDSLAFLRRIPNIDLVVSANLLSQLAIGADRRLARNRHEAAIMPDDAVAQLVAAHLDGLAAMACRTCLVTDISYVRRNRDGTAIERADLLFGVRPPDSFDVWEWTVAPFGEEDADIQRIHRVIAAEDIALPLSDR